MSKTKIAIIEDDFAILQMYKAKFDAGGYEVQTAQDGQSGLELIESFKPNLILLDLMMPTMSGLDVLERVKKKVGKEYKIIALTNMADRDTQTRLREYGVSDYIVKAEFTPTQVEERVKKVLAVA